MQKNEENEKKRLATKLLFNYFAVKSKSKAKHERARDSEQYKKTMCSAYVQ